MSLIKKITQFVNHHQLIIPNQKIVVGFSGGPDSVFLVHLLCELQKIIPFSLHLAHLDHHWRQTSLKDAEFCVLFARSHNLQLTSGSAHDFSSTLKFNGSKEEFARNIRKAFFRHVMTTTQSDALALAHHADDQLETFLIRLTRGTTISGIKGMLPKENGIIRPLLATSKKEILDFLHEHAITYCTDETNSSDLFLRNRIRNTVIPVAQQADPRFIANSLRTITHLADAESYLALHTQDLFNAIQCTIDDKAWVNTEKLFVIAPFMQNRIIMHWLCTEKVSFNPSEKLIQEIIRFLHNKKSLQHVMHSWAIKKEKHLATIIPIN